MPRFKFRLESLEKYRERRLLVAKKDLLEVQGRHQDLVTALHTAEEERKSVLGFPANKDAVGFYAATLAEGQSRKIDTLNEKIRQTDAEIVRHRSWVAHLSKELKAVERLEEKKRQEFDENLKKADRRFQDGWVVERWALSRDPEDGESDS